MSSNTDARPRTPGEWLQFGAGSVIVTVMCFPAIWMVYSAFKSNREIFRSPFGLPAEWRFENFTKAWIEGGLGALFLNTIIVTGLGVAMSVFFASMAAYAFTRLDFPGRRALARLFLVGLLLPPPAVAIALFTQLSALGLINTLWALILTNGAWTIALTTYLLGGYFRSLKREMEEAALLEGANRFQIFWHVVMPLVKPAMITVAILNAINIWNELLFALLFISDDAKRTLPAGIVRFSGYHSTDYSLIFAALTITTIPIMIFYFICQRHVMRGLTAAVAE
ncbi:carbohydrate ABC transporter permease [Aestuariivirga sp. YIM B02566]|uniref:Carbohydrate ABC transporter permease n=1 Tax=Taklimakanibacter albus TaxID=2800327 RepID=A0ACC5R4B0_9HYPH|nr:carbohydrate ABC transporter permease [Aestuariivirga sp. YIM B02566]MBK1867489.1 carbohydrate ABC transporter permease [Aestuariivirga sp. YIM B02566]